nr:hypothetical protein [Volvox africanus]
MFSCFCITIKTNRYSKSIVDVDGKVESNQSIRGDFLYTALPSDVSVIPGSEAAKSGPAGTAAALKLETPTDTVGHQHPPFPVTTPKGRSGCIPRLKATLHRQASAAAECTAAPAAATAKTSPATTSTSASTSTEVGAVLYGSRPAVLQSPLLSPQSHCLRRGSAPAGVGVGTCCISAPAVKVGSLAVEEDSERNVRESASGLTAAGPSTLPRPSAGSDQVGRRRHDGGDGGGDDGDGDCDGAAIETVVLVKNGDAPAAVASPDRAAAAAAAASDAGGVLLGRPDGGVTWDDASVTPNPTITTSVELHSPTSATSIIAAATAAAAATPVAATAAVVSPAVSRRGALIQAARAMQRQTSLQWTKAAKWSSRTAAAAAVAEVLEPSGGDLHHINALMATSPGENLRIVRLTGDDGDDGAAISAVPRSVADGAPGRHTPLLLRRRRVATSGGMPPTEVIGEVGRGAAQHTPSRRACFAGTGPPGTDTTSPRTTAPALLARQQTPCPLRWPSAAPVWEDSCDGLNEAMEALWQAPMTPMDTVITTAAGADRAQRRIWQLAAAAVEGNDTDLMNTVDTMMSAIVCTQQLSPGSIAWTCQSLQSQGQGQQGERGRLASQSSQPHPHLPTLRVQLSLTKLRRLSASSIVTLLAVGDEVSPPNATTATPATSFSMALRSSNAGGGVGGNGHGIGGGGGRYGAGVMTPTRRGRRRNLAGNEDMSWDAVPPRSPIPNPALAAAAATATATILARTRCGDNSETSDFATARACGRCDDPPIEPHKPSVRTFANPSGDQGAVVLPGMEGNPAMTPMWPAPTRGNMLMDGSAAGSNVPSFLARQGNGMSRLASPPHLLATATATTADGLSAASTPGPQSSEGPGRSPPPRKLRSHHFSPVTTPHTSRSGSHLDLPRPASFSDVGAFAQGGTAPARRVPRRVLYHTSSVRSHAPTEDDSAESLAKLGSELGYGSEKDMDVAASMENLPWGSRVVESWTEPQLSQMGSGEGLPAGGGLVQVKKLGLATSVEEDTGRVFAEEQRAMQVLDAGALLTAGGWESPTAAPPTSPVTSGIAAVTSEYLKVVRYIGAGGSSRLSRCT